MVKHKWKKGKWIYMELDSHHRLANQCAVCHCYRVAIKTRMDMPIDRVVYFPHFWDDGDITDATIKTSSPACIELLKY